MEKPIRQGKKPFKPEPGRLNLILCTKLLVLWLLAHPEIGKKYPYPRRQRRGDYANYYEAYKANEGWTGQELAELIQLVLGTQWRPSNWLMYNAVLGGDAGLATYEWVLVRQDKEDQNYTRAWYRLNDNPFGDPSRPAARAIEQDKENLAHHLRDLARFIRRMDELVYGGHLLR